MLSYHSCDTYSTAVEAGAGLIVYKAPRFFRYTYRACTRGEASRPAGPAGRQVPEDLACFQATRSVCTNRSSSTEVLSCAGSGGADRSRFPTYGWDGCRLCHLCTLRRFYHGHVESVQDIYSGLVGPLIIYEEGILDDHGLPTVSFIWTAAVDLLTILASFRRIAVFVFYSTPKSRVCCLSCVWHVYVVGSGEATRRFAATMKRRDRRTINATCQIRTETNYGLEKHLVQRKRTGSRRRAGSFSAQFVLRTVWIVPPAAST